MRVARRFVVSGRVQGVGFRYFTQDVARQANVTGLVRNLPDGRVEVLAEGEMASLDQLEVRLRHGPARARVSHLEVDATPVTGRYAGFLID
jgi:acylphosphatase